MAVPTVGCGGPCSLSRCYPGPHSERRMHEISVVIASEPDAAVIAEALGGVRPVQAASPWWLVPIKGIVVPDLQGAAPAPRLHEVLLPLIATIRSLSLGGPVALAFTQYSGGGGSQAAAVIDEAHLVYGPYAFEGAINDALAWLGVEAGEGEDEFEALGLDRWRSMDALAQAG
jgi:hypothetical protein